MASDFLCYAGSPVNKEFDQWWNTPGAWVEPPNQRRGGTSGVQRHSTPGTNPATLYIKRQHNHTFRSIKYPLGVPTALREQKAIRAIGALGIRVPKIRFCGVRREKTQWQSLLVTEALQGYISLECWLKKNPPEIDAYLYHRRMIGAVASTLKRLHSHRWIHGCCYPKHIFVKWHKTGEPDIALLDLEKARRRLRIRKFAEKEVDQFLRHCPAWEEEEQRDFFKSYRQ